MSKATKILGSRLSSELLKRLHSNSSHLSYLTYPTCYNVRWKWRQSGLNYMGKPIPR